MVSISDLLGEGSFSFSGRGSGVPSSVSDNESPGKGRFGEGVVEGRGDTEGGALALSSKSAWAVKVVIKLHIKHTCIPLQSTHTCSLRQ